MFHYSTNPDDKKVTWDADGKSGRIKIPSYEGPIYKLPVAVERSICQAICALVKNPALLAQAIKIHRDCENDEQFSKVVDLFEWSGEQLDLKCVYGEWKSSMEHFEYMKKITEMITVHVLRELPAVIEKTRKNVVIVILRVNCFFRLKFVSFLTQISKNAKKRENFQIF